MAEPSATNTPDPVANEDDGNAQGKASTSKDRQCRYCGQAFTSSSLGRHLDQYLSKKKPDGVHDVEEIKRIRGGITRRQARSSSAKQLEDVNADDNQAQRTRHSDSPITVPWKEDTNVKVIQLNMPNWETTGVINGLPGTGTSASTSPLPSISLKRAATAVESPLRSDGTDKDTIRALELALREVLGTVEAASAHAAPKPSPFDFDFQGQTYPSLCLRLLTPPPMLFSSHPFSTPRAIPIEPPGMQQLEPIKSRIQTLIDRWRIEHLSDYQGATEPYNSNTVLDITRQHMEMARQHLEIAYQNWAPLPAETKQEQWRLELLRAYVQETSQRKDTEDRLDRLEQESRRLQAQVDMLSRCQWPREFALFPPVNKPLSKEVSSHLQQIERLHFRESSEDSYWNYENMVKRWRRVVADDSARRLGMAASSRSPVGSMNIAVPITDSPIESGGQSAQSLPPPQRRDGSPATKRVRLSNGRPNEEEQPESNRAMSLNRKSITPAM